MAMSSVLTFGQWGYPIQGLGSYGGAEEEKPSSMRVTSDSVVPNRPGRCDPTGSVTLAAAGPVHRPNPRLAARCHDELDSDGKRLSSD